MNQITITELAQMLNETLPEGKTFTSQEEIKEFLQSSLDTKINNSKTELENQLKKIRLENNLLKPEIEQIRKEKEELSLVYQDKMDKLILTQLLEKEKSEIKFKPDISALEKIGFEKLIQEKYQVHLSGESQLEIKDKSGKSIYLAGKSKPANVTEVLNQLAQENKLLQEETIKSVYHQGTNTGRVLHPKAVRG